MSLNNYIHAEIITLAAKTGKDSLEETLSNVIAVGNTWAGRLANILRLDKIRLNTTNTRVERKS